MCGAHALVGPKPHELVRGEEGERAVAKGRLAIAEVETAQGHRFAGVPVVEFQPVSLSGNAIGEPLVDGNLGLRGERDGGPVGRTGSGVGQLPSSPGSADREIGHLQSERESIDTLAAGAGQEEGAALRVEFEPGMESGPGPVVTEDHEVAIATDLGVHREGELPWLGGIVAEAPARETAGGRTGIAYFQDGGERSAPGHRAPVVGQHFIEEEHRRGGGRLGPARGSSRLPAGGPVGRIVRVAGGVDQDQGRTAAVGRFRPAGVVVVIDRDDGTPQTVEQGKALSAIGEAATVGAEDGHPRVTHGEGIGIVVGDQDQPGSGGEQGSRREAETDAGELHVAEVGATAPDVLQLDELEFPAALRIVHDFSDADRRDIGAGQELGLGEGAPGPVAQGPGPDGGGVADRERAGEFPGRVGDRTGEILPHLQPHGVEEIGAAEAVVETMDREDIVADHQLIEKLGHVEAAQIHGGAIRVVGSRGRIPGWSGGGIGSRDAHTVEIGHEAIVVADPQLHEIDVSQVGGADGEGDADITGGVLVVHPGVDVDVDERSVVR